VRHGSIAAAGGSLVRHGSLIRVGRSGATGDRRCGTQGDSGVKVVAIPGFNGVAESNEPDAEAGEGDLPQCSDLPSLAGQIPSTDPLLLVEYCVTWLPADLARLPELDIGEGLMRPLHCYAHGGFMGAAISMLADPEVRPE
jgi:hypothetical protein